jgi:hypothetical protein
MTEIMNINTKKATSDPESIFSSPEEVTNHVGLTRGQKIATLKKWVFMVRSRLDAVNEGMTTDAGGSYTRDSEMLRQLEKNIEVLRVTTPARQKNVDAQEDPNAR